MKQRLLIAEGKDFSSEALKLLEENFYVIVADLDRTQLLQRIDGYDALWVRLRTMLDADFFRVATRLKVIATNTTGLTHIDLTEAQQRRIAVVSLRGENSFLENIRATAELTLAITLACIRNIPSAHADVLYGGWDRTHFKGSELFQKQVGIVGYGRLGKMVSNLFSAFGSTVLVTDPRLPEASMVDGFEVCTIKELFSRCQIVSLHASYSKENQAIIGEELFSAASRGLIFVNTARGELVDEHAMLRALTSGQIGGLALDVISHEQEHASILPNLRALAQAGFKVVLTPHLGGFTHESLEQTELFLARKLVKTFGTSLEP